MRLCWLARAHAPHPQGPADWRLDSGCKVNAQTTARGVFYKIRVYLSARGEWALAAVVNNNDTFARLVERAQVRWLLLGWARTGRGGG